MIEINNHNKEDIDVKKIQKIVEIFLKENKILEKDLSIAFVGEQEMQKINLSYRQKNSVTDVLSFSGEENDFGELIICYEQIKRQAGEYGNTADKELVFILVHGLLHLLGYEDDTEEKKQEMIKLGEEFIKKHSL